MDWLGGLDETLAHVEELQLVKKAQPGVNGEAVYRQLKQEMWRETIAYLEDFGSEPDYWRELGQQTRKDIAGSERKVQEWEEMKKKPKGQAKL